jgi:hypothetical protein
VNVFAGAYGDKRRAVAIDRLSDQIVCRGSVVIRDLGGDRKGELSAHRVLDSPHVTPGETIRCVARRTAAACAGRWYLAPPQACYWANGSFTANAVNGGGIFVL